jgi:ABC-2 family transporter protein
MSLQAPAILTFKPTRLEWAVLATATVVLVVGAIVSSLRLQAMTPPQSCLPLLWGAQMSSEDLSRCPMGSLLDFRGEIADRIAAVLPWLMVLGAAVIGSQIVAREVEGRTTPFIWALEPTRRRWLTERWLLATGGLVALATACAAAAAVLASARFPGLDINRYIPLYGQFGPIIVVRVVAVLCLSLLVGTVLNRAVPAVLFSLVLAVVATILVPAIALQTAPTYIVDSGTSISPDQGMDIASGWVDSSGRIYSDAEARRLAPNPDDSIAAQQWVADNLRSVSLVVSADSIPAIERTEAIILCTTSILAVGCAYLLVRRKRI